MRKHAISMLAMMMKKGVHPNVVTYGALMGGYFLVNQLSKAINLFTVMV
jgi:pentatricopeptide repeat protein